MSPKQSTSANLFVSSIAQWASAMQRGDALDATFFAKEIGTLGVLIIHDPAISVRLKAKLNSRCTPEDALKGLTDLLTSISISDT